MAQEETFQGKRKSKPEFKAFAGKEKSMKKHKKIISLLLALVMVCSFMAMSASAATTEVQPRGTCPNCINGYVRSTKKLAKGEDPYAHDYDLATCTKMSAPHAHYKNVSYTITAVCSNCGYKEITPYVGKWCPYGYYGG